MKISLRERWRRGKTGKIRGKLPLRVYEGGGIVALGSRRVVCRMERRYNSRGHPPNDTVE